MLRKTLAILFVTLLASMNSAIAGSGFYLAYKNLPLEIEGYQDAFFNDAHRWGDAWDGAAVYFSDGNGDNEQSGFAMGYTTVSGWNFEYFSTSGDRSSSADGGSLGYEWRLAQKERLDFSIQLKGGYAQVETLLRHLPSMRVSHIDLAEGNFYQGDEVISEADGGFAELAFQVDFKLGSSGKHALFLNASYVNSFFGDPVTKVAGVEITDPLAFDYFDDEYFYEDINIDPFAEASVEMAGLSYMAGYKVAF